MHHRHARHDHEAGLSRSRLVLLVLLCVAQLMVILDISAVNVALPDVAGDLGNARVDARLVAAILLRDGAVGRWLAERGVTADAMEAAFPESGWPQR